MKFGSIAASRGRNFARAYCGLNLRATEGLENDGEDEGQGNDTADGSHEHDRPGLALHSFGEASKANSTAAIEVDEGKEDDRRCVDSRGGAIARPDVTHPESGWVNQRPPRAEDRVLENAASGNFGEHNDVDFPLQNRMLVKYFRVLTKLRATKLVEKMDQEKLMHQNPKAHPRETSVIMKLGKLEDQ
jgi:hypothetical protein